MRVVVVGCGAMGSLYAAFFSSAGHQVHAVARSRAHVDAINASGLRLEGASGDRCVHIQASQEIPRKATDLVIVAVKATQISEIASAISPLVGNTTRVLAIQNGIGSADILAQHIDPKRLFVGIASGFGASMRAPGHAHHNDMNMIRIGSHLPESFSGAERLASEWQSVGFKTEAVQDVAAMQWEKLICNVAYSAPCALTGATVGQIANDQIMGPVSRAAAVEAWSIARAAGVCLKVDDPNKLVLEFAARMPEAKPSVLQDLENGRPSEIDVINGAVVATALKLGMQAPVNATLVALIKWHERACTAHPLSH